MDVINRSETQFVLRDIETENEEKFMNIRYGQPEKHLIHLPVIAIPGKNFIKLIQFYLLHTGESIVVMNYAII